MNIEDADKKAGYPVGPGEKVETKESSWIKWLEDVAVHAEAELALEGWYDGYTGHHTKYERTREEKGVHQERTEETVTKIVGGKRNDWSGKMELLVGKDELGEPVLHVGAKELAAKVRETLQESGFKLHWMTKIFKQTIFTEQTQNGIKIHHVLENEEVETQAQKLTSVLVAARAELTGARQNRDALRTALDGLREETELTIPKLIQVELGMKQTEADEAENANNSDDEEEAESLSDESKTKQGIPQEHKPTSTEKHCEINDGTEGRERNKEEPHEDHADEDKDAGGGEWTESKALNEWINERHSEIATIIEQLQKAPKLANTMRMVKPAVYEAGVEKVAKAFSHVRDKVDVHELRKMLRRCNSKRSGGGSGITREHLLKAPLWVLEKFVPTVNSILEGTCEDRMKLGTIVPLIKDEARYRPIALLEVLWKCTMTLVSDRLLKVLHDFNLLENTQYAFNCWDQQLHR